MTSPLTDLSSDHLTGRSARRVARQLAAPAGSPPPGSSADGPTLDIASLIDIAVGLARATGLWQPHVSHDRLSRTSVRLVATDAYEVWMLGWTPGQRVEFHDHGGANAALVVLEGELHEITLGFAGTTTKRLGAGAVGSVPSGVVHDVVNAGTAEASSLHVYSDPLRTMTYYEADGTPSYTEVVQPVPALVTSAAHAKALHPSAGIQEPAHVPT